MRSHDTPLAVDVRGPICAGLVYVILTNVDLRGIYLRYLLHADSARPEYKNLPSHRRPPHALHTHLKAQTSFTLTTYSTTIMSPRSWTTTISLLFQTPMIPTDNEIMENKQVEIPMMDFSPSDSSQSPVRVLLAYSLRRNVYSTDSSIRCSNIAHDRVWTARSPWLVLIRWTLGCLKAMIVHDYSGIMVCIVASFMYTACSRGLR